jgi:hypothetical protein
MGDALFFFLLLAIPYTLLIFYAARRWRRLQPAMPFSAQVRGFLSETVLVAVLWFVLALGVVLVLTLAGDAGASPWLTFFFIIGLVAILPYYGYALVGALLAGPDRTIIVGQTPPSVWDALAFIAWPLGIVTGVAFAAGLLLLLSYVLWQVKRARHAAPAAPGGPR